MNIHPGLIGFDIDGVVADTMEAFIRVARQDFGINSIRPDDITSFTVENCLSIKSSIINDIFQRLMEDPAACGLKPMHGAVEVLQDFSSRAPLTFITARPEKEPIHQWLVNHLGSETCHDMRLIATGEHDGKGEHAKSLGLKFFIDDRAETCAILKNEGINPFVYDQPWNRGAHAFPIVHDWLAVSKLCVDTEEQHTHPREKGC